jgi:1A family penicillin-binding protein
MSIGKRILLIAGALMLAAVVALVILLDVGSWPKLDMEKLSSFSQSTRILDGKDREAAVVSGAGKRTNIALSEIPTKVQEAFLAAEDARFYKHPGVDLVRIGGALIKNVKEGEYAQGASTITQQLIKLTHLTSEKTVSRKLQEAFLALQLERRATKQEILEMYLNAVYFGKGAYGVEAASEAYFGIHASKLTLGQGALLAGILKSPSYYAPHLHMDNSIRRRKLVLDSMVENGFITQEEADQAAAETVTLVATENNSKYAWYVDQTVAEACSALGIDSETLLSGGYTIYTALNTEMQESAQALYQDPARFPSNASDGEKAQAALVALNPKNGEVLSLVGGRSYDVQRGLNRATDIKRQPGSTFKPISVYAAAIDRYGMLPSSLVDDTQRSFGNYAPRNFGGHYYGVVTLRDALSKSLNVATVDLLARTDVDSARFYAQKAGVNLSDQDENLALALGALTDGVSPLALCGAYAPLASGGYGTSPHLIRKITDVRGQTVYEANFPKQQVMKAESAYMITDMLKTAAKTGSAKALSALGYPVAGKTGTVGLGDSGNRDAWTVAYTPNVCVAVWMGFDNPDSTHKLSDAESGSNKPAKLAAEFLKLNGAQSNGGDFPMPATLGRAMIDRQGLMLLGRPVLPSLYTPKAFTADEVFPLSQIPTEVCPVWKKPTAVYNLQVSLDSSFHPKLSFTAVQADALYRIYRVQGGQETLLAELSGQLGDRLEYVDSVEGGGNLMYYVRPVNNTLYREGVLLEGDSSQLVAVAQTNPLLDWLSRPEPTPTPMPVREQPALFQ